MRDMFLVILVSVMMSLGCNKIEKHLNMLKITQDTSPNNQFQISVSPDGKYRAEAYGTISSITAGGLFPYEGIRVVKAENGDIIWKMEPGYYVVKFSWSPDSRYVGIYYEARIWGESVVFDVQTNKLILLPTINEITQHYSESVKPQENRPDPYLRICGWKDAETIIVNFRWNKKNGEYFNGQYAFNVNSRTVSFK
jgi:hypothetical protein